MNTQHKQKQTIEFTKKQFEALLKAVYLGNWVANVYRTKDFEKDYESIEDFIFSHATQFGFDKYVNHEESDGSKYYPKEKVTRVHMLFMVYLLPSYANI